MKKIIITILMAMICISTASATNFVDSFLGIQYEVDTVSVDELLETKLCPDEYLFRNEVSQLNKIPAAIDFLDVFDDGDHVLELTRGDYMGETQFTIKKNNKKIVWIKKGICATSYDLYRLNFDLHELENKIIDGTFAPISDGYHILNNIDGISLSQKFRIVQKAITYGFSKGGVHNG